VNEWKCSRPSASSCEVRRDRQGLGGTLKKVSESDDWLDTAEDQLSSGGSGAGAEARAMGAGAALVHLGLMDAHRARRPVGILLLVVAVEVNVVAVAAALQGLVVVAVALRSVKGLRGRQPMRSFLGWGSATGLCSGAGKEVGEALMVNVGKVKVSSGTGLALWRLKSVRMADQQPGAGASLLMSSWLSQLPAVTMTVLDAAPLTDVGRSEMVRAVVSTVVSRAMLPAGVAGAAEPAACCCCFWWVTNSTSHARYLSSNQ
jgi:hypothetical protein